MQIASRAGAPDGALGTIEEGQPPGSAGRRGGLHAHSLDPDPAFFGARQKLAGAGPARKSIRRGQSAIFSPTAAASLAKRLSGVVAKTPGDLRRRKTALGSLPGGLLRAGAQAEAQRKSGAGAGKGGAGKGERAYTKLNLALVKEDGGELGRQGEAGSGSESSGLVTSSDGANGRGEEGRSAAQTERGPTPDASPPYPMDERTER